MLSISKLNRRASAAIEFGGGVGPEDSGVDILKDDPRGLDFLVIAGSVVVIAAVEVVLGEVVVVVEVEVVVEVTVVVLFVVVVVLAVVLNGVVSSTNKSSSNSFG